MGQQLRVFIVKYYIYHDFRASAPFVLGIMSKTVNASNQKEDSLYLFLIFCEVALATINLAKFLINLNKKKIVFSSTFG